MQQSAIYKKTPQQEHTNQKPANAVSEQQKSPNYPTTQKYNLGNLPTTENTKITQNFLCIPKEQEKNKIQNLQNKPKNYSSIRKETQQ